MQTVLRAQEREIDTIRAGIIDVASDDAAQLHWGAEGDLHLRVRLPGPPMTPLTRPRLDLVLAMPSPKSLQRVASSVAMVGVGTMVLCGAAKVEPRFWGTTTMHAAKEFWSPQAHGGCSSLHHHRNIAHLQPLRAGLVDGLEVCGDVVMPHVFVQRNLQRLLENDLDEKFGAEAPLKLVAHPGGEAARDLIGPAFSQERGSGRRVILAIGPAGGWTEEELELFKETGFKVVGLGDRVLRTETATIALMAMINDLLTTNKNT